MKIILQEKIANLGQVGDQVNVKPGYARNYLIPKGKVLMATPNNIADFEKRRAELEKRAAEVLVAAQARADKMAEVVITLETQASEEGKLFGSIGPRDIAEAVVAAGHELNKSEVLMPEGPIRQTGEYEVHVQFHSEVTSAIKVIVNPAA